MTADEVIHNMIHNPPPVMESKPEAFLRRTMWVCIALAALSLIVAIAVGATAYFEHQRSAARAIRTAQCLNQNVRQRGALTTIDEDAHIAWANAEVRDASIVPYAARLTALNADRRVYVAVLQTNQAIRAANPLGTC